MPNEGDQKCIDGGMFKWAKPQDLIPPTCPTCPQTPSGEPDYTLLLTGILNGIAQMAAYADDNAWPILDKGQSPYYQVTVPYTGPQFKKEIDFIPSARSLILVSDFPITIQLYDQNFPDLPIQNVSGALDQPIKQLSIWNLPKSRAIDKIFITTSTAATSSTTIQLTMWG